MRVVFGVLLATAIISVIFADKPYLEIGAGAFAVLAAREWHRMVGKGRFLAEVILTTATVWIALAMFLISPSLSISALILSLGTLVVLITALLRKNNPIWHAAGVIYFGLPALSIIALRDFAPLAVATHDARYGAWVLVGLFLIVWATDTGALLFGRFLGGPKLAPVLSPNKTWSGALGGMAAAAVVEAIFILIMGGNPLYGAIFGVGVAVVAHFGDLFESWVKRRFHVKDSGSMIPGHGGVLDRIDSTLATLVAVAVLVLVLKLDPLFGAYS
nr:phosphatidate cytidylyltransferase [Rhizomicrobium palustre]